MLGIPFYDRISIKTYQDKITIKKGVYILSYLVQLGLTYHIFILSTKCYYIDKYIYTVKNTLKILILDT